MLDLLGDESDGCNPSLLIGVGLAAAGPTAFSGAIDWGDTERASNAVRRAGLVHAASSINLDRGQIVCGCHGSTFDLRDGSIQRGPATAPQPTFDARRA